MSQDDPPDPHESHARSAPQLPRTSGTAAPRTDLIAADAATTRLPDEPREAAKEFFQSMGLSVQSGPSLSITAFGSWPESAQKQYLENDAQRDRLNLERDRLNFELEQKQIDGENKERDAQRAHELAKMDRTIAHQEKNDRRMHWSVIGAAAVAVAGAVALFASGHETIASNVVTALVTAGLAYQSGKGAGNKEAHQQMQLQRGQHGDNK